MRLGRFALRVRSLSIQRHLRPPLPVDQEGLAEFRQLREEIDPAVEAELYVETMLDLEKGIKEIKKVASKQHGVKYSTTEIGDYLSEMDSNGEFLDIELDAIALQTLFAHQGANQAGTSS